MRHHVLGDKVLFEREIGSAPLWENEEPYEWLHMITVMYRVDLQYTDNIFGMAISVVSSCKF